MWNLPKTRTVFETKLGEFTVVLIPTTTGKAAYLIGGSDRAFTHSDVRRVMCGGKRLCMRIISPIA
ncbi:hypothetical protein NDI39_12575 [Microcoleus sp. ZQ-A2]|nr:hypothetical protein [Microcoleus sp. FACHB-1]